MFKYVLSIRPEYRTELSPGSLAAILAQKDYLQILEGHGRRTVTVSAEHDVQEELERDLPQVSVRAHDLLRLLA